MLCLLLVQNCYHIGKWILIFSIILFNLFWKVRFCLSSYLSKDERSVSVTGTVKTIISQGTQSHVLEMKATSVYLYWVRNLIFFLKKLQCVRFELWKQRFKQRSFALSANSKQTWNFALASSMKYCLWRFL